MARSNRRFSWPLIAVGVAGLFALGGGSCVLYQSRTATINDVAVRMANDDGYKVVAVDGQPEQRQEGLILKPVPYVEVNPGSRSITVEDEGKVQSTFKAEIAPGARYRIARGDSGLPTLVPDLE